MKTNFQYIESQFNPNLWKSIDEFEQYYLRYIQETLADRNYYTDRNGVEREIDFIDHYPKLKEYEVWIGDPSQKFYSKATLYGKAFARNFAQACDIVMCKNHLKYIKGVNKRDYENYCPPMKWQYNPQNLTDWSCRLYWSEELAIKSFK